MKILCMALIDHPEILSGVSTFERRTDKIFNKWGGVVYLTYKVSDKKYFKVNNIIEYDKNKNIVFKLLYKIFGSKNLLKWQVKK